MIEHLLKVFFYQNWLKKKLRSALIFEPCAKSKVPFFRIIFHLSIRVEGEIEWVPVQLQVGGIGLVKRLILEPDHRGAHVRGLCNNRFSL
jgi:hypothetical protein